MPRHDDFQRAVEAGDLAELTACFAEDATFHSPAVFEDFRYGSTLTSGDGRAVLEFHTRVGDKQLHGIDLLTFDEATGLVTDLTVMLRPLRGLEAAVAAIGQRLAAAGEG